jgi:polyphosphate kinase
VTVVIELRARFDEEANLGLADRLQDAGVQVVYGVVGYKTHAKMLLIVRREGQIPAPLRAPGHRQLPQPAPRAYTDFSLMTADPDIGNDVHLIFQQTVRPGRADEAEAPAAIAVHPAQGRARAHRAARPRTLARAAPARSWRR